MDKVRDEVAEPEGKAFSVDFEAAVLERDGSEVFWFVGTFFFGKKDNVRFVYRPQVRREVVETRERIEKIMFNKIPMLFEKSRPETVRPRAGVVVHGEEGSSNVFREKGRTRAVA
jgi:hypothetical protein